MIAIKLRGLPVIVTCPSCTAKYRVRDEAVEEQGSELECPECRTHFIVKPPSRDELGALIENLTHENQRLETKVIDLEQRLQHDTEALGHLQTQLAATAASAEHLQLEWQSSVAHVEALMIDNDALRSAGLQKDDAIADFQRVLAVRDTATESLRAELSFAKEQLRSKTPGAAVPTTEVASALASITPMLWVLTQTIDDVEAKKDELPGIAAHLNQLRLLSGLLERLISEHAKKS